VFGKDGIIKLQQSMKTSRITVLMPVYNAEKFLSEAIDSILSQTYRNFDFLIIDDGSTDRSAEIVRSYNDPRIRFIQNEKNLGISATLNKGIDLARTDLIARMDADDISYPKRLQKQYEYMLVHPECALLSTWCKVVTEDKKFIRLERYRTKFYYYNLTFECWMYHPTIMFRKAMIEQVGKYSMPYSEDYDLFWKTSVEFRISNLMEPLLDYRLSPSSLNTVLRKQEYDVANEQNVLRNIRFYMGENFRISKTHLEILRHNFQPILSTYSIESVFECLDILDAITERIMAKDNPNWDPEAIKGARYFKRQFIITEIAKRLPGSQAFELLLKTQTWLALYQLGVKGVVWRLRKVTRIFF
jgi:glycosyltransferase involved in cell wall biosynthesis